MDFDLGTIDDTTKLDAGVKVREPKAKKAAKKAKPKAGKRPVKAAKKAAKLPKLRNTTKFKVKKTAKPPATPVRTHRVDLRLTKAEKVKLQAKAKATRRTVTSIMLELIEKMR